MNATAILVVFFALLILLSLWLLAQAVMLLWKEMRR